MGLPGEGYIELAAAVEPAQEEPRLAIAGVRVESTLTADVIVETWRAGEHREPWSPSAGVSGFHEQPFACFSPDGTLLLAHHTATQAEAGGRVYGSFVTSEDKHIAPRLLSEPPNAATTTIASSDDGSATLVWAQTLEDGRIGVSVTERSFGELAWSAAPAIVSIPVLFANDPRVVRNGKGDTLVSWYQSTGDTPLRVYASLRSAEEDDFVTPSPGETLSATYEGPEGLDGLFLQDARPAIGEGGQAVVFWTQPNGQGASALYFADTQVGGNGWHLPATELDAFTAYEGVASDPVVAFGDDGHLFVAWRRTLPMSQRIEVAARAPSGVWVVGGRSPIVVAEAPTLGPPAMVVLDGHALLAWQVAHRVVRTTFIDGAEPSRLGVEDLNLPSEGGLVGDPVVASNRSGHALVAWVENGLVEVRSWSP